VAPLRYQYCEAQAPDSGAIHRMETNYRYAPASTTRSFKGAPINRCEGAWVQSQAIFDAVGTCGFVISGCSKDANNSCQDGPEDWTDYDFLGATVWSDQFTQESAWPRNVEVKVHSGLQGVAQWTRHRHWGWADPARYAYLGVVERPFNRAAAPYPRCYGMAYLVGLFNGVWNTPKDAEKGLDALKAESLVGQRHRGAPIKHQVFYNQTGCSRSSLACIEDLAETFIQRSAELDGLLDRRWEHFWEQVTGAANAPQSFTELLRSRVLNGAQALSQWLDALAQATLAKITALMAQMVASPPTAADTANHVADLVAYGQRGYRAVLVGHSQGNLFASAAYDGYLAHSRQTGAAAGQDTGYVAAQIVHIAPASAVLRGPHVLAEVDLVIEAVRRVDGTPVAVNTLSADALPRAAVDWSGHRLLETYLDPARGARAVVKQLIVQSMDAL
jgi:hypothetical protein